MAETPSSPEIERAAPVDDESQPGLPRIPFQLRWWHGLLLIIATVLISAGLPRPHRPSLGKDWTPAPKKLERLASGGDMGSRYLDLEFDQLMTPRGPLNINGYEQGANQEPRFVSKIEIENRYDREQSTELEQLRLVAGLEQGDRLWLLGQSRLTANASTLWELNRATLEVRRTVDFAISGTAYIPMSFTLLPNGRLAIVGNHLLPGGSSPEGFIVTFDPEQSTWSNPVSIDGPMGWDCSVVARSDNTVAILGSALRTVPGYSATLDPHTGQIIDSPIGDPRRPEFPDDPALRDQMSDWEADLLARTQPLYVYEPPVSLGAVVTHPADPTNGPTCYTGRPLKLADPLSLGLRAKLYRRDYEVQMATEARIPAAYVYQSDRKGERRLEGDLAETLELSLRSVSIMDFWAFGLDGTSALIVQYIAPVPPELSPDGAILRFGLFDPWDPEIAWKSYVPIPRFAEGDTYRRLLTILPGSKGWTIYFERDVYWAMNQGRSQAGALIGRPEYWCGIPNPVDVPVAIGHPLTSLQSPVAPGNADL